ncbi:hypothetical protein AS159_07385 [Thermotoga sp. Ku-13t]|uniref:hypothetical protein n=1 Tax=Thermotoga sp. Ku-13t TaxID=1755813 RepID=UPI0013ED681B|nr:hypothetical protein [Thermotoga sp. Ku-13t]KAF2957482.1 hypothetical protein AS159_07385 [Thermotoga sp. Ku-13t]
MTPFGFATICFSLCLIVALFFQFQAGAGKEIVEVQPFPKVVLVSPIQQFLMMLRQRMNLIMEVRQLPAGSFSASSGGVTMTVRLDRLSDYMSLHAKKGKPSEDRIEVDVAGSKKLVRAAFQKEGMRVIYSATIYFGSEGQVLASHLDVARVLNQVLNGEPQYVNVRSSSEEYVESLKMLAQRYGVEVRMPE